MFFNYDDEYKEYVMAKIKPNMIVLGSRGSFKGNIGRVISSDSNGVQVKWANAQWASLNDFINLELLTPPLPTSFFND